MSGWRGAICSLFKVPPEPAPPPGAPPRTFRAAPAYFYLRVIQWAIGQVILVGSAIGICSALVLAQRNDAEKELVLMLTIFTVVIIAFVLFQLLLGLLIVRLDYEMRWYMVSDRAIRIREGIATVKEKTIALANIQNISIHQGPLQRMLGIADVEVKTAGGGSGHGAKGQESQLVEPLHVARFRGVSNAEEIRNLLTDAARRHRDAGLGDPDDVAHHESVESAHAAQSLLREVRETRFLLERALSSK